MLPGPFFINNFRLKLVTDLPFLNIEFYYHLSVCYEQKLLCENSRAHKSFFPGNFDQQYVPLQ